MKTTTEKGKSTVYLEDKENDFFEVLLEDFGFLRIPTEPSDGRDLIGLDDPDVIGPMKGLRELISAWALEWCD